MSSTSTPRPTRINAHLDEDHSAKLALLRRVTRMSVTDIVKRGIDLVYADVNGTTAKRNAFTILTETGFIGSAEGATDLSERYKEELRDLLESKHGDC